MHYRLLPALVALLIRIDLLRFRRPADGLLVVVSHTALRLLALSLGYRFKEVAAIAMALWVERSLQAIVPATGAKVVVLDVEHSIRAERIARRNQSGTLDVFDRFMGGDPERSERIEQILGWLRHTSRRIGWRITTAARPNCWRVLQQSLPVDIPEVRPAQEKRWGQTHLPFAASKVAAACSCTVHP